MATSETVIGAAAAPSPTRRVWTADEVRALIRPDRSGPRYELIDGELLVTPSPFAPHQRMLGQLHLMLAPYVDAHGLGETYFSPADIDFDGASIVQPDLFVVPPDQLPDVRWQVVKRLTLAIEIPSRGSDRHDRGTKRRHYQKHGVAEYWIVDLKARLVERWRPEDERPEILHERLAWAPCAAIAPLVVDLVALFDRVLRAKSAPTP